MIAWLTTTSLGRNLMALGTLIGAVLAALSYARWTGAASERGREATRRARADTQAHERMNHADDDPNASVADNRRWMRELAAGLRARR